MTALARVDEDSLRGEICRPSDVQDRVSTPTMEEAPAGRRAKGT